MEAQDFWIGSLYPYSEEGEPITERYEDMTVSLLVDEARDYLTFNRAPDETALQRFYEQVYPVSRRGNWYNAAEQYRPERWTGIVESVLRLARSLELPFSDIRVHDVGCGFGGLVAALYDHGLDATGTDLCTEAVEGGRTERGNKSIYDVPVGEFLVTQPPQHIVVMHHVLEHALEPLELVRSVAGHLDEGGYIIIRCPNSRFYRSMYTTIRAHWYGYPKHLHYFGPQSLDRLVRQAGLGEVVTRSTESEMRMPEEMEQLWELSEARGETFSDLEEMVVAMIDRGEAKELEAVGRRVPV